VGFIEAILDGLGKSAMRPNRQKDSRAQERRDDSRDTAKLQADTIKHCAGGPLLLRSGALYPLGGLANGIL